MQYHKSDECRLYIQAYHSYIAIQKEYATLLNRCNLNLTEKQLLEDEYQKKASEGFLLKEEAKSKFVLKCIECIENSPNKVDAYFDKIKSAIHEKNLILLEALLDVSLEMQLMNTDIDLFILKRLTILFKEDQGADIYVVSLSKLLFERILDTSDNDLNEYSVLLSEIFTLGKADSWYADFSQQIQKMLAKSVKDRSTFEAALTGLNINNYEIQEELLDFINYHFISNGKVDDRLNWLEGSER